MLTRTGIAMQRSRVIEYETLRRIWANPAIEPCPNCTLMKPKEKRMCECCLAEERGEYLSDHQDAA